jgi:uncharacterized protein (TIGR03437 family)
LAVTAQSVLYSPLGATLKLVASNPNPAVSFSDPLPGLVNSYTGADRNKWVTGIQRYATATLKAIYPGIDAQYTADTDGTLTLHLLCQPGVDPNTIVFQIPQAMEVGESSDGSLVILFGPRRFGPTLTYAAPLASQATASGPVSRNVSFEVQSTTMFGLAVQGLDTALPLQIAIEVSPPFPPQRLFYSPGTQRTIDSNGNTFFATTISDAAGKDAPFPTIAGKGCGVEITTPVPCSDVAIYKYSPSGTLDFITYLAGRTSETAAFVGLASSGALVVAGTTDSSDFPVTPGALQPDYAGPQAASGTGGSPAVGGDFFAVRLDPVTGHLLSSTFLGGPNADTMGTAALGADGSLYFLPVYLGHLSKEMPVSAGTLQSACDSDPCPNGYVAHVGPALDKLTYGTYLPGIVEATARLYSDGSVYYAGRAGPGFPTTPTAYQPRNAGGSDGIVARLDPTGSRLLFGTYIGTPDTDLITRMAVAPDGSVWAGVDSYAEGSVNDQYKLVHLDANGSRLLAQQPIEVDDMIVDPAGNLFAFARGEITVSPGALLASSCGTSPYVELTSNGQQLFATYLPADVIRFDGTDAQGTPYLDTLSGGRVQVVQGQSMGPFAGCVVDAASFTNGRWVSPGAIVTIFGSGLGPSQGAGFQLLNGQVPTSLGGTQVLVNGEPAPILYSSYWQLNVILPYSLVVLTKPTIQVVSNGTQANQVSALVLEQGISIFQVNNLAAALNEDGTLNSPQNPAKPGSTVALFGTGGGQTIPPSVAGEVTPFVLRPLANTLQVEVDRGPPHFVEWAGAAPGLVSGVTQINVKLPDVIPVIPGYPTGTVFLSSPEFFGVVTISVAVN